MEICLHDTCFDRLRDMGIIYNIYLDIILSYSNFKMPLRMRLCDCSDHVAILQIIFELEKRFYVNIFEISEHDILIVPRGVDMSQRFCEGVFVCNCVCSYE